jgi:hypothetical protein
MHPPTDDSATLFERAAAGDAEACFELGRRYAAEQSFSRARRWLRDAVERGHAGAATELGLMQLFGIGLPADHGAGVALLLDAERRGSAEAQYQLALMGWCGTLVPFDLDAMARRLRNAAQAGFVPALRTAALVYARMPGAAAAAHACLERAAVAGDATACHLLARRLARATDDAARARAADLDERAQRGGIARAGTSGAPDGSPYAMPAPLDAALPALDLATPMPERRVRHSQQPRVETVDDVFSPEECEFVIALGEPFLEPSTVHDAATNTYVRDTHRTSSGMAFYQFQEDFALRWLQWRQLRLLGDVPLAHAEYMTLLRYRVGEEYRPHRDYLAYDPKVFAPTGPGQRVHTVFCYLNDVAEGGETVFPLLGVTIAPKVGRLVLFRNVHEDGEVDESTLHAGLPVRRGEKWLATLWTHERRFREY